MFFELWESRAVVLAFKAANGQKVAYGEGYTTKQNCIHAIELVKGSRSAPVRELS